MRGELSMDFSEFEDAKLDSFFKRFAKLLKDKLSAFVDAHLPAILLLIERHASYTRCIIFHCPLITRVFGGIGQSKKLKPNLAA